MHGRRKNAEPLQNTTSQAHGAAGDQVSDLLASPELAEALETEHFKRFLDHIPFAIAVSKAVQGEQQIVYINRACARLVGRTPPELLGQPWSILDDYRREDDPNKTLGQTVLESEDFLGTFYIDVEPGKRLIVDAYASPIELEDSAETFRLAALLDVTGRDRAPHAAHQEQTLDKDLLLKELQHRVKNSLQIITALIRFEARNAQHGKTVDFDRIASRIDSLSLLYDALAHAKGPHEIDLGEYLTQIASAAMRSHASEGIRLDLNVERCPVSINVAMPTGLVVNETMTNTFKYAFADRSGGTITLRCLREANGYLIVVADDGNGLPAGTVWPSPGKISALIVQSLQENAKASVKVESAPQRGTKVSIFVPAAFPIEAQQHDSSPGAAPQTRTVLVVDDDQDVLEMIGAYLKQHYRVLSAKDGAEALALLTAEGAVDLILTDIVMPGGIDGFEVARRANKFQPNVRVLYMSGFLKSLPPEANGVIYDRFLKKPFRLDELESELSHAFSKQPFEMRA